MRRKIAALVVLGACGRPHPARVAAPITSKSPITSPVEARVDSSVCFDPDASGKLDRLVVTDHAATFCVTGKAGKRQCAAVSLDDGTFRSVATPEQPTVERHQVSPDGKLKLGDAPLQEPPAKPCVDAGSSAPILERCPRWTPPEVKVARRMLTVLDVKSGKTLAAMKVEAGEYKCFDRAQFIGSTIYATASWCDNRDGTIGFLYKSDGSKLGKPLDTFDFVGDPVHLHDDIWAITNRLGSAFAIFDARSGKQLSVVEQISSDDERRCNECAGVVADSSITPLAMAPSGKLVEVGDVVAVIDPVSGKVEHRWPLPTCAQKKMPVNVPEQE